MSNFGFPTDSRIYLPEHRPVSKANSKANNIDVHPNSTRVLPSKIAFQAILYSKNEALLLKASLDRC